MLERPEYADYGALKWADLLRVDRQILGHKRAYAYYRWIRESFARNKPFDQFARELLTAEGPLEETGPANFYKVVTKAGETVHAHDVTILAPVNVASTVAFHASQMFGRNMFELLKHLVQDGALRLDPADEITGAMMLTHEGRVLRQ